MGLRGLKRFMAAVCLPFVLSACEAPLDMRGVEKTQKETVRRTDTFQDVVTLTDKSAVFVGGDGIVLEFSSNGEVSRSQLGEFGARPSFVDVTACSNDAVFALSLDGNVWQRVASGSWQIIPVPTEETLQAIECGADGTLWLAASFSTLFKSADVGKTWQDFSTYEDAFLTELRFVDAATGFAIGEFGTMMKTVNGGDSWDNLASTPYDFYPLSSYFADAQTGWLGGLSGDILKTSDGGQTWYREQVDSEAPIYRIAKVGDRIFAIGNYGTFLQYEGEAWVRADTGITTFGYLRAIAGNQETLFLGGQALATKLPLSDNLIASAAVSQKQPEK